jgi:hypothetical protein
MNSSTTPAPLDFTAAPLRETVRQLVVRVDFESRNSRRSAIGGGESLAEALAFARESLPAGRHWRVTRIRELYGE